MNCLSLRTMWTYILICSCCRVSLPATSPETMYLRVVFAKENHHLWPLWRQQPPLLMRLNTLSGVAAGIRYTLLLIRPVRYIMYTRLTKGNHYHVSLVNSEKQTMIFFLGVFTWWLFGLWIIFLKYALKYANRKYIHFTSFCLFYHIVTRFVAHAAQINETIA